MDTHDTMTIENYGWSVEVRYREGRGGRWVVVVVVVVVSVEWKTAKRNEAAA